MKKYLSVSFVLILAMGLVAAAIIGYQDWQLRSAPGNPASGYLRMWADSGAAKFKCLTSAGASCYFDSPFSSLTTTGTSGAATLSGGVLNVPVYASGGGGGGGLTYATFTDPSGISFSWRNQGGATENISSGKSIYLLAPATSGDQVRGLEVATGSTPWSYTVVLLSMNHAVTFNQAGLYITDGTKLESVTVAFTSIGPVLAVNKWTNVSTVSSTPFTMSAAWAPPFVFLKIFNDGTNIKWYWSPDGINFDLLFSEAKGAFLSTITDVGFYADSNNSTSAMSTLLISWLQGTS